jgi:hypothetical protein
MVINEERFFGMTNILSVSTPRSLISVGDRAFANDKSLTTLTLSDGLKKIGRAAFMNTGMRSVNIPGSVVEICAAAFRDCPLESFRLNEGLVSIGPSAFQQYFSHFDVSTRSIEEVTIPTTVTSIWDRAFYFGGIPLKAITFLSGQVDRKLVIGSEFIDPTYVETIVFPKCELRIDAYAFAESLAVSCGLPGPIPMLQLHYVDLSQCTKISTIHFTFTGPTTRMLDPREWTFISEIEVDVNKDSHCMSFLSSVFRIFPRWQREAEKRYYDQLYSDPKPYDIPSASSCVFPTCKVKFAEGNVWEYDSRRLDWKKIESEHS